MAYKLTAETLAEFRRDGFVVIDDLIPATEIARLRSILMKLHENNVGFEEGAQFDAIGPEADAKERRFPQIIHPRVYAKELMTSGYYQVALEIARQILGDKAHLKEDISFMKPARIGSITPWHQDEAFNNPAFDHKEITIWLAVTPAGADNSCMSFIPGSNLFEVLEHQPVGGDPRVHALECIGDFDRSLAVECPLRAGSCTIHDNRTLHYAGPNISDSVRMGYALLFAAPPVPRAVAREFSWSQSRHTDGMIRQQVWSRKGGIILEAWRRRHRLRLRVNAEIRRLLRIPDRKSG
jgi:ectoine hydroxylase-related dioxygenase (phytanoyl-CoA dioxygenase family)